MSRETDVAENIVNLVLAEGRAAVGKVAAVVRDIRVSAIEHVAEDFAQRATKVMNSENGDPAEYRFYQAQVRHVRSLKNQGTR